VVHFRDNHLSYAITWYLLALMVAAATVFVGYTEYRHRRDARLATGGHLS
jgi:surfeit locus 1 family protein